MRQDGAGGRPALVGRTAEVDVLRRELAAARDGRARVVLVSGEPGIGKTHLCRAFLDGVVDFRVLQATAEESERTLPYGVLDQLLVAAGAGPAAELGPTPLAAGAGFLQLLSDLQSAGPVLLWVDDLQWADPPSQRALLFAVRRLEADAVLVVLSLRGGTEDRLTAGLARQLADDRTTRISLDGLTAAGVVELAQREAVDLGPAAVTRLHAHTGGNPLWTLAMLREVPRERWAEERLPLPAPTSFAASVAARVGALGPDARALTEAAAVAGSETPLGTLAEVGGVGEAFAALQEAAEAGLLAHDGAPPLVRPWHAMVRSAVYEGTHPVRRSELHRELARVAGSEFDRLQHEMLASPGHDAKLSTRVGEVAAGAAASGQWSVAADLFARAARLAPDPGSYRDLIEQALAAALVSGETVAAEQHAEVLEALPHSTRYTGLLGTLRLMQGRHAEAERLLMQAVHDGERSGEPTVVEEAARMLAHLLVVVGRSDEAVDYAEKALALDLPDGPQSGFALGSLGVALATSGRHDELERRTAGIDAALPGVAGIPGLLARGTGRVFAGRYDEAVIDLDGVIRAARAVGTFEFLCVAWAQLAQADYHLGRWDEAVQHGQHAVQIVLDAQQTWAASPVHSHASLVFSRRGQWAFAEAHARAAVAAAASSRESMSVVYAATSAAVLAHSRGRFDEVVSAVSMLDSLEHRVGVDEPGNLEWPFVHGEALVRIGRLSEAEEFLDRYRGMADRSGRSWPMSATRRAQAVLRVAQGELDDAESLLDDAVALAVTAGTPFDRSLAELELGRVRRRTGRRDDATSVLLDALATFQGLRATPFVALAEAELAAVGGMLPMPRHLSPLTALTRQERTIARLVRQGLSNREIAHELFISAKTVEYHLGNAYRKLGVSSRTQLVRELSEA